MQPWDATELCVGKMTLDGKGLTNVTVVAGGFDGIKSQAMFYELLKDVLNKSA